MDTSRFKLKYREFLNVLRHEYHYIFHDGGVVLIVIGAIFIYATAYAFAYKNEVLHDIPVAVIDHDQSNSSRQLIRSFDANPNLAIAYQPTSLEEAKQLFYD
ncbi:MAG: ABC transporter permease, partial [Alistipes sp.]|nr:ABC transporter permease [Alistipes sp.]